MSNRFLAVLAEIQNQISTLQTTIDQKKDQLADLQTEIPILEAQLASLNSLYTDTQLVEQNQPLSTTTATGDVMIVHSSPDTQIIQQ